MKLLTLCLLFSAIAVADDRQRLEGSWTGESLCAGVSPACHDEKVIYTFGAPDSSGSVNLSADKIVDGKRINMGSTKVHFDSLQKTVAWRIELGVWQLHVDGSLMEGTLTLNSGEVVRRVKLKKD